jgi:hypothetical protein
MLQSMLRNRDAVDVMYLHHTQQLEEYRLLVDGWEQLAEAVTILQLSHSATLCMESDFSELHNILVEVDFLQATFTSVLQKYQPNPHLHIRRASAEGIVVLDKYWELCKELTAYVAAVGFHPAYQLEDFEVAVENLEWTEDRLQNAKLRVQGLWLTKYMPESSLGGSHGERQPDIPPSPVTPFATWRAQR